LSLNKDMSETSIVTTVKNTSDEWDSNIVTRNIFVNTRPHIIDYHFEKDNSTVTQIARWGEKIDLILKIKDYNGCDNIDNAIVKADLSNLWLTFEENISFVECDSDSNTATYKKSGISTDVEWSSVTFTSSNFSVLDEDWNKNEVNDSNTSFDNEDKKDSFDLAINSAGTPDLYFSIDDSIIWWESNNTSNITYSWSQKGEMKISLWSDSSCDWWTTLEDWNAYDSLEDKNYSVNSDVLSEWDNNIYICLKNSDDKIWSITVSIKKDTVIPDIKEAYTSPVDITTKDSSIWLTCSEAWKYIIEKWWNWTVTSGEELHKGDILAESRERIIILNSQVELDENTLYAYCIDEAWNVNWSTALTIIKTTEPPSFKDEEVSFEDKDTDNAWLDSRDLSFYYS
jgi:hypothetical protein